jgi:uncharacterized protein (DUF2236 family)
VSSWAPPWPLTRPAEAALHSLLYADAAQVIDFAAPDGEPALLAPDAVAWRVFKNPVSLFVGGIAAVVLELAEPRVCAGVWQHSDFRHAPRKRLQRTGLAALLTVYGPRHAAEAMIAGVTRRHAAVQGHTAAGLPYHALDVELLDWVHTTASFGFLQAAHVWLQPLSPADRERYWAEGRETAQRYGALGAPTSEAGVQALFAATAPRLESSDTLQEFLRLMRDAPVLPVLARPLQRLLVRAGVALVPAPMRKQLGLDAAAAMSPLQRSAVRRIARAADGLLLDAWPPVQACRRLGLPRDHLYR